MAKVKQINLHSVVEEVTDTNTKYKLNDWIGLVSEIVYEDGFHGTVLYFPGVKLHELKAR